MKRKILAIMLLIVILITACGEKKDVSLVNEDNESFKIGILQYIEHKALDDTREGFLDYLDEIGLNYEYDLQNAQGDLSNARTMAEKFKSNQVDLIFAIGTSAAEAASSVTDDIPILFSAVTDPVESQLVESMENPGSNVSGTSDASDIKEQLKLFNEIDENIKDIGIVYSLNETNSLSQLETVKEESKDLGLNIKEMGIENISDLPQSANSLVKDVDGMFILSDNKIASSISLLADILINNNKPSICVEESQVKGGALMTIGLSYYNLGKQTGKMAEKILIENISPSDIPCEYAENVEKYVNKDTLIKLGYDENMKVFEGANFVGNEE